MSKHATVVVPREFNLQMGMHIKGGRMKPNIET